MCKKVFNETIVLKKYIFEKEYKEIKELEKYCNLLDKVNLKLELNYRISSTKNTDEIGLDNINEFLYYIDDNLVSYLGISSFGRNIAEINGMTHPSFRRKGLFNKLFHLSIDEYKKRNFDEILLLSDGKSKSGIQFIEAVGGQYDFSEYRMKLINKASFEDSSLITLRPSNISDKYEIAKQNGIFFGMDNDIELFEDEVSNAITYMIELDKEIISKIKVEYTDNSAFICGFGLLPKFRGKGYGKVALKEVLHIINKKGITDIALDVECKNNTALTLYKSCGFEEISVMNYYSKS